MDDGVILFYIEGKNNKEKNLKNKEQRKYDKGQIFVKVMAGILALLMILSVAATLIFSLI